jgi:acyl-CoA reductase-like NAD-dependent aldehyde dehydrogenase
MMPLALGIAGGNTALLILSPETVATSKVLHEIAKESVDSYTCAVVNPGSREEFMKLVQDFGNREFQGVVVQSSEVLAQLLPGQRVGREIIFMPAMPAAIIVTRNADIELAAKEVTVSKFTDFSSRSVSAPGLVMVDEFVLDNFVAALEKEIGSHAMKSLQLKKESIQVSSDTVLDEIEKRGGRIKRIERAEGDAMLLIGNADWR